MKYFSIALARGAGILARLLFFAPDVFRAKLVFFDFLHYWPQLDPPRSFNEKILWRKIHDLNPVFFFFTDKIAVRDYVAERIGKEFLTTLYQVERKPEKMDWEKLPQSFILKPNHTSGAYLIVRDKSQVDASQTKDLMRKWLESTHVPETWRLEKAYSLIDRRIYAEELLLESNGQSARDFKFYTYDGVVHFIRLTVHEENGNRHCYFDRNWQKVPYSRPDASWITEDVPPPRNLSELLRTAETLGKGIDFVRVDLYSVDDRRILFGEMTVYPASGMASFVPREGDFAFGAPWNIPSAKKTPAL
jgi:hypothetical protein